MKHYCITTTQVFGYEENEIPENDYRINCNIQKQYISCSGFKAVKKLLKAQFNALIRVYESIDFKDYEILYKNFKKANGPVGFDICINDPVLDDVIMSIYAVETE